MEGKGTMSIRVEWVKCQGDKWCPLQTVDLGHSHFNGTEGVYVIWHAGGSPATVRVGQGVIGQRLSAHRLDPEIQRFERLGLYVTWATVAFRHRDGVEAYLHGQLRPKVGSRYPDAYPIEVNLPR